MYILFLSLFDFGIISSHDGSTREVEGPQMFLFDEVDLMVPACKKEDGVKHF